MSAYTALKKYAKRKAGCWSRINHKRDMRAASKATRKELQEIEDYWKEYLDKEHTDD